MSYNEGRNYDYTMKSQNGQMYNNTVMKGGRYGDDINLYKARKYHEKCHQKIKEIMAQGKQCPAGFEQYLKPFDASF